MMELTEREASLLKHCLRREDYTRLRVWGFDFAEIMRLKDVGYLRGNTVMIITDAGEDALHAYQLGLVNKNAAQSVD